MFNTALKVASHGYIRSKRVEVIYLRLVCLWDGHTLIARRRYREEEMVGCSPSSPSSSGKPSRSRRLLRPGFLKLAPPPRCARSNPPFIPSFGHLLSASASHLYPFPPPATPVLHSTLSSLRPAVILFNNENPVWTPHRPPRPVKTRRR